jgi:hypothetical protein
LQLPLAQESRPEDGCARPAFEPFAELAPGETAAASTVDALMQFGGFPEPLLAPASRGSRWRRNSRTAIPTRRCATSRRESA